MQFNLSWNITSNFLNVQLYFLKSILFDLQDTVSLKSLSNFFIERNPVVVLHFCLLEFLRFLLFLALLALFVCS